MVGVGLRGVVGVSGENCNFRREVLLNLEKSQSPPPSLSLSSPRASKGLVEVGMGEFVKSIRLDGSVGVGD